MVKLGNPIFQNKKYSSCTSQLLHSVGFKMTHFVLLLLLLGSLRSARADICKGDWKRSSEEGKMVVRGNLSVSPSLPFVIDFDQFSELGESSITIHFIPFVIIFSTI